MNDGSGIRIRKERQEYPNKRFDEAIDEKMVEMRTHTNCIKSNQFI